jgi:hypothetical protein
MTIYPIAQGTLVNLAAFKARYDLENTVLEAPWVQDVPQEQFVQDFADWEPEIQALLDVRLTSALSLSRRSPHVPLPRRASLTRSSVCPCSVSSRLAAGRSILFSRSRASCTVGLSSLAMPYVPLPVFLGTHISTVLHTGPWDDALPGLWRWPGY